MNTTLTPELLAALVAGLLSLLATYVPGFNAWFAALAADAKRALMGIAVIVISLVVYVLACSPDLGFTFVSCPTGGIWSLLSIVILSLTSNQAIDRITPEPAAVKEAKPAREP